MTADQIMGLLRQILPAIGGLAVALGWLTTDQVSHFTSILMQVGGPVLLAASAIWAVIANSKKSIIASATAMPEVDSKKLASAIDDPALKVVAQSNATPQGDK